MPLRYQGILETLDTETQAAVSSAYLELCQMAEAENLAPEKYEKLQDEIARCLLMSARDGERDRENLMARAATFLPARRRISTRVFRIIRIAGASSTVNVVTGAIRAANLMSDYIAAGSIVNVEDDRGTRLSPEELAALVESEGSYINSDLLKPLPERFKR